MISAVGAPAVSNLILVPSTASSSDTSSNESSLAVTTAPIGGDVLSLSQPESLATSDGFYQRTSLQIRAHSHVKVTDDGQVRAMSHTRLRFSYDFEAADGTRIRIRAKVNLHYSQINDSDEGSQSTRLRVKARVSVLQESVSTGIASLLETPEVCAEAKNGISQAIDLFYQVTDAAASLFLDSNPLDGDALIAGLVEAFNGLSESLNSIFLPPPADPEGVTSADVVELLEQVAVDPGEVLVAEPDQIEAVPPGSVESEPLSGAPPQDIGQSSGPENELAENVGQRENSALENEVLPEASEQKGPSEGQEVEPATIEKSQPFVGSVMFRLRLQVIQSLTDLIGVFDSDSPSLLASQSIFRASAQFAARYNVRGPGVNDSLSQDSRIDTQV